MERRQAESGAVVSVKITYEEWLAELERIEVEQIAVSERMAIKANELPVGCEKYAVPKSIKEPEVEKPPEKEIPTQWMNMKY